MSVPSSLAFLPESFHRVAADGETIYGWVATEDDAQQVTASVNREFTTSFIAYYLHTFNLTTQCVCVCEGGGGLI